MLRRTEGLLYSAALLCALAPLWVAQHLPMVDLPQHLHLISVLHRLDDPTTLYPDVFAARHTLTPYLGYYYAVSLLNWLLPLETANRLFLSASVAGLAASVGFLLRSLGRPAWPSLLTLPCAYGDSFGWGFVNYCAALPLAFVCCGLLVRALVDAPRRRVWALALAPTLVAVLLFHVQAFAWLALALPWLLLTTRAHGGPTVAPPAPRSPGGRAWLVPRLPVLAALLPAVAVFLVWVGLRLGQPAEVEVGAPWKAWGPMLSAQNLAFKSFGQNRDELPRVLANLFHDGRDRWPLGAVAALALVALGAAWLRPGPRREGALERWRMVGLAGLALALYFLLPFDIRGYMYYLNTRFAHPAAALLLASVPVAAPALQRVLRAAAAGTALLLGLVLGGGFRDFSREAAEWDVLVAATGARPRVMGLVYEPGSRVVRFPVFLHGAAVLARERGGLANFSFALTPHSPLRYQHTPPPTFPSEWRPQDFRYPVHGPPYDHFLVRGVDPARVFGARLASELAVVAHAGQSWLVRRR